MSKTRNLSDLLDANGDVKSTALDNVPASDVVNDTTPQLGGDLDTNNKLIQFGDSSGGTVNRLKFGASQDLQIYHDGSNSYINDSGTGNLVVRATELRLNNSSNNLNYITCTDGGATTLFHNGSSKLATSSTGATVTGTLTADGVSTSSITTGSLVADVSGTITLDADDAGEIRLKDGGTQYGAIKSDSSRLKIQGIIQDQNMMFAVNDGGTETTALYFDTANNANAVFNGSVTATAFSGDGSALTNVPAGVSNMNTVTFTSSGTYTPTSGTKFVTVYVTGGGGGGGSAKGTFYESTRIGGGGGSAGTAIRTYSATELGSSATITMGSGGSGGSNGGNGSGGGTTTFNPAGTGTTITGNGGSGGGGVSQSNNAIENGGNGGGAGGGTLNISGTKGEIGRFSKDGDNTRHRHASGSGAVSYWGGAGDYQAGAGGSSPYTYNGGAGALGGGGGGGLNNYQIASASGGSGGTGVVLIMEFA